MSGQAVYAQLKQEMWRETVDYLEQSTEQSIRLDAKQLQWRREREKREKKVQEWEKAKL